MKRILLLAALVCCLATRSTAGNIIYTKNDSVRAESIIKQALAQPKGTNTILFIGKKLLGLPYVAKTLEKGKTEQLVINTTQLDCTTFVENVLAMYLCVKNRKPKFSDFCNYIRTVRYNGGKVYYPARLHYFSTWIESNTAKGLVKEVQAPVPPFSSVQTVYVDFMTTHASLYPLLDGNAAYMKAIAKAEKTASGKKFRYIPTSMLRGRQKALREAVKDGDIIALVTKKKGLDISHVGYACWHKDGLHLMNASSLEKKVIDDSQTLYRYMKRHPSNLGIRVIRVM